MEENTIKDLKKESEDNPHNEKISANHISDKALVSGIYKLHFQLHKKTQTS